MRIPVFLIAAFLPMAAAGEVEQSATLGKPWVTVAVDPLVLREEPSLDADVVIDVPVLDKVAILDDNGPAVTIDGRADKWVRVAARCADKECTRQYSGWVLDSQLGYDERFTPLASRPAGRVTGYSYGSVYSFAVEADGGFTRWSAPCATGACGMTPGVAPNCGDIEEERDGFCVATGRLYRYREAIRGKDADGKWLGGVKLKIDDSGELCAYLSEWFGAERMCERSGPFAASGSDPKAAVEAVMAVRRKVLALVAADMLNLRAEPATGAEIVSGLPRGSEIEVLDTSGPAITVDGQADRWVKIRVLGCDRDLTFGSCEYGATGWAVDGFLAYEDRLKPVTEWREGELSAYGGDHAFGYDIAADGTVSEWETCGHYNNPDICRTSGRLYRYRDLIVAKLPSTFGQKVDVFHLDNQGRLCFPPRNWLAVVYESRCYDVATGPLVAADMLNLRAEPAAGADVVTRAPRGSRVTVLEPAGPAITVGGRADHWVKIRINACFPVSKSGLCERGAAGWAVDGFLAYEDRLKPVTEWRAGMISGYGGGRGFSYLFLEDGTFEYTGSCGDYRDGKGCTADGRLYRYRDLVLARVPVAGRQDILYIDGDGRLCFLDDSGGEMLYETNKGKPTRCDR